MARPAATFAAAGGIPAGSRLNAASAAQQAAASSALPSIQSPPAATGAALGPQTLFFQRIFVPANSTYPIQSRGNYLYIEGIVYKTANLQSIGWSQDCTIRTDTGNSPVPLIEAWREVTFPEPYNFLEIKNPYACEIVVSLWFGFGQVRRDRGRRIISALAQPDAIFPATVYAANKLVSAGPLRFNFTGSPQTQRARIRKAIMASENYAGTTNADFTLFLAKNYASPAYANADNFALGTFTGGSNNYVGQIRFPSFVTGAAGDTMKICELAELDVEISTQYTNSAFTPTPNFQLVGALVANAAYSAPAFEQLSIQLEIEYD